jgi:uncharacterized protein (DUF433 family)
MKPHDHIAADLKVMTGKPVVAGTRIPVELVLAKLADNLDLEDLFDTYPRLTREDVKACLRYSVEVMQQHGREVRQELRIKRAADQLKAMILKRYPDAMFTLTPDVNSRESFLLNVAVDVEDTDEVMDLVVDRVVDFSVQGVPIHVHPERPRRGLSKGN